MNLLLLGNGFDLYHKLPTRYDNFLHTVDFLIKYYKPEMRTVADVFGDSRLQKEDAFICECFNAHKIAYEKTILDEKHITKLIELSKDNLWFQYLLKIFDNKVGWIDFEKEIAYVLDAFKAFLKKATAKVRFHEVNKEQTYIIKQFNFFLKDCNSGSINGPSHSVIDDFTKEYPLGSGVIVVNKEKIINHLLDELNIVAKILRLYLEYFIESTLLGIKQNTLTRCPAISHIDKAISFNYTSSYEQFYLSSEIFHLHGDVKNRIIIGVNPDSSDEITSIDVSFAKFKKYFQRTQYNTDLNYINWLKEMKTPTQLTSLIVMGHSLDVTDQDIILELFARMDEIIILYHNEEAKNTYISNLINMYGKEGLDDLRKQKGLILLPLNMDFSGLIEKRSKSSFEGVIKNWVNVI